MIGPRSRFSFTTATSTRRNPVRILAAVDKLGPGKTLSALLLREPVFLFHHLEKRGFRGSAASYRAGRTTNSR